MGQDIPVGASRVARELSRGRAGSSASRVVREWGDRFSRSEKNWQQDSPRRNKRPLASDEVFRVNMSPESQQQNRLRLESWVTRYGVPLRAHLFALVRRNDVADDLLQETFRRAWQALSRYQEQNNERGWLFRLADRTVADHWRKVGRDALVSATDYYANERPADLPSIDRADASGEPLARLLASEERTEALRWLDALNESQRRVLLLRFFGELEFAEIAAHLEVPLGTVLSQAHRGLNQLRILLATRASRERTL